MQVSIAYIERSKKAFTPTTLFSQETSCVSIS